MTAKTKHRVLPPAPITPALERERQSAPGSLARLSEGVIEAGWLMAAALTPLFFNSYSPRAFDGPKVVLIRVIALVMLLAWGVRVIEQGHFSAARARVGKFLSVPLVIPALYLGLVAFATSLTSLAPSLSLWGSYQRLQGAFTSLAGLAIFLLALAYLRRPAQLERLVSAILLSSWPVALYSLFQEFNLDPIAWQGENRVGVLSSLGHPLYLAGYLALVMPLTAARLWQVARPTSAEAPRSWRDVLSLGSLGTLFVLQVLAFLFTQSRAPTVGLLLALVAIVFALALKRGLRGLAILAVLSSALVLTVFVLVSLPNTPLPSVRDRVQQLPYVGRISRMLDTEEGAASFRLILWDATTRLLSANPTRFVLGYGPETYAHTILPHLDEVELIGSFRLPERAHNETFEQLATSGVIGLLAHVVFAGGVLLIALQAIGVAPHRRQRVAFVGMLIGLMGVGALLPWLVTGRWLFSGLGFALALPLSVLLYLIIGAFVSPPDVRSTTTSPLAYGLLAGLLVHLVDISFAFETPSTQMLFLLYAAAMVAVYRASSAPAAPEPAAAPPLGLSVVLAAIIATLALGFADPYRLNTASLGWVAPALGLVTFLIGSLTIVAETRKAETGSGVDGRGFLHSPWGPPVVALNLLLLYVFTRLLVEFGLPDPALLALHHLVWTVIFSILAGWFLAGIGMPGSLRATPARGVVYGGLAVLTLGLVWGNARLMQADVYLNLASAQAGQAWDRSQDLFRRAINLSPDQSYYHQRYAQAIMRRAQGAPSPVEAESLFEQGARELELAQTLAPWSIDPLYNAAQFYLVWAQNSQNPRQKAERVETALRFCEQAAAIFPADPNIYVTYGLVYQLKGQSDLALQNYQHAARLSPYLSLPHMYIGNIYQQSGRTTEAIAAYQAAIDRNSQLVEARRGLAGVYMQQGNYQGAIEQSRRVAELLPDDFASRRDLALVLREAGQYKEALEQATIALNRAPSAQRAALTRLVDELRSQQ